MVNAAWAQFQSRSEVTKKFLKNAIQNSENHHYLQASIRQFQSYLNHNHFMSSFSLLEMTLDAAKAGPLGCDFIPVITAPRQAGTKRKSLLAFVSGVSVPKDSLSQLTDHFTPFTRGQEGDLAATLGPALHL